jgi:hydroxymethylglutaryl-CoA lyase
MCRGLGIQTGVDLEKLAKVTAWLAGELGRELPGRVAGALHVAGA